MRTLMLAAIAALTITSAQAQDPVADLVKTIAHSQGVLAATEIACGVRQPTNYRRQLTEILLKRDGKFMAQVLTQVRDQEEAQYKNFGPGSCTQQTVALMRNSANMLASDLAELDRRLSN